MTQEFQTPAGLTLLDMPVSKEFLEACQSEEMTFNRECSALMVTLAAQVGQHYHDMAQSNFHIGVGVTDPDWVSSDLVRLTLDNLRQTEWHEQELKARETYFTSTAEPKKKKAFYEIEFELISDLLSNTEQLFDYSEVIANTAEKSASGHVYGAVQFGAFLGDKQAVVTLLAWPSTKNNEMKYRCTVDVFVSDKLTYSYELAPFRIYDEVSRPDFNSKAGLIGITDYLTKAAYSAYACIEQLGKPKPMAVFEQVLNLHAAEHFSVNWANCFDGKRMQEAIKYFYIAPYYEPGSFSGISIEFVVYPKLEIERLGMRAQLNAEFGSAPPRIAEEVRLLLVEAHLENNSMVNFIPDKASKLFLRTEYFSATDFDEPMAEDCEPCLMSVNTYCSAQDFEKFVEDFLYVTYSTCMDLAADVSING